MMDKVAFGPIVTVSCIIYAMLIETFGPDPEV